MTRSEIDFNREKASRSLGGVIGVLATLLLIVGPQVASQAQTAAPALDLDRSGRIDGPDLFLFGTIWTNLYDLGLRNFNIADYFPLTAGNRWHYTAGAGQPTDNNFAFVVEAETEPLPGGLEAVRVLNDFDDPNGQREGVVDLWRYDEEGNLFYEGFSNEFDITLTGGVVIPPQTAFFTPPLLFGKNDQEVTEVLQSSASATVQVMNGEDLVEIVFDVDGEILATSFLETFGTELGQFTDVLRMIFDVELNTEVDEITFRFRFLNNTVFFKRGVGPIGIDLFPDVSDFNALTIDEGTIVTNGTPTPITAQ